MTGTGGVDRTDKHTTAKKSIDEPGVTHLPQMFRFGIQIRHETNGHGHVRDYSSTALNSRTKAERIYFPLTAFSAANAGSGPF